MQIDNIKYDRQMCQKLSIIIYYIHYYVPLLCSLLIIYYYVPLIARFLRKHSGAYESVREPTATPTPLTQLSPVVDGLPVRVGADWPLQARGGVEPLGDVEQADSRMELARVKMADADVKIIRATNYVKVNTSPSFNLQAVSHRRFVRMRDS